MNDNTCSTQHLQHTTHTIDSERKESDWSLCLDINENSAHSLLSNVLFSSAFYLLHFFSTKGVKKQGKKFASNPVTCVTVASRTRYIQFPLFSHFSSLFLLVPTSGNRGVIEVLYEGSPQCPILQFSVLIASPWGTIKTK